MQTLYLECIMEGVVPDSVTLLAKGMPHIYNIPIEGMLQHLLANVAVHHRLGGEFWIVRLT